MLLRHQTRVWTGARRCSIIARNTTGRQQQFPDDSPSAVAQEALDSIASTKDAAQAHVHDVATKGANALTRRVAKQRGKYQALHQTVDQHVDTFASQFAAVVEQIPTTTPHDPLVANPVHMRWPCTHMVHTGNAGAPGPVQQRGGIPVC